MAKDPACLFYIDTWLTATAEMDADCRGWYLNLILHQYDKKTLPNDIEKLAVLACVKFSEFERFKQVFEQVLKHKFTINEQNRLENNYAKTILQNRELFKSKRSNSGKISYCMKWMRDKMSKEYNTKGFIEYIKNNTDWENLDTKNEQMFEHLFKQMFELYINENENINKDKKEGENKFDFLYSYIADGIPSDFKIEPEAKKEYANLIWKEFLINSQSWIETTCMLRKISDVNYFKIELDEFLKTQIQKDTYFKGYNKLKDHFINYLNKKEKSLC